MHVRRRIGIAMLWLGVAYMVVVGWVASWSFGATFRSQTLAEVNETVWALNGPLFWSWALSVPVGAVIAGVGLLLFVNARASHVWVCGVGMLVALFVIGLLRDAPHFPPVYGVVGGLILGSFLLILWLWAKKRQALSSVDPMSPISLILYLGLGWLLLLLSHYVDSRGHHRAERSLG